MEILLQFILKLGFVGTSLVVFISTNALFFKMDDLFSKEFRDDVALMLMCVEPKKLKIQWYTAFIKLFDKIFKKNSYTGYYRFLDYLNFHTLIRSSFASLIFIIIIYIIMLTTHDDMKIENIININSFFDFIVSFSEPIIVLILLNIVPDYFSLLQTRYFLEKISRKYSITKLLKFLVIDFVLSFSMFVAFFIIIISVTFYFLDQALTIGDTVISKYGAYAYQDRITRNEITYIDFLYSIYIYFHEHIYNILLFKSSMAMNLLGISFYSGLFTSIWIWVFSISKVIIRAFEKSDRVIKIAQYVLPVENKPFRSIGIVSAFLITLSYLILIIINRI